MEFLTLTSKFINHGTFIINLESIGSVKIGRKGFEGEEEGFAMIWVDGAYHTTLDKESTDLLLLALSGHPAFIPEAPKATKTENVIDLPVKE